MFLTRYHYNIFTYSPTIYKYLLPTSFLTTTLHLSPTTRVSRTFNTSLGNHRRSTTSLSFNNFPSHNLIFIFIENQKQILINLNMVSSINELTQINFTTTPRIYIYIQYSFNLIFIINFLFNHITIIYNIPFIIPQNLIILLFLKQLF